LKDYFSNFGKKIRMATDITNYVSRLTGEMTENAYKASDALGRIGSEEVVAAMTALLDHPYPESRIMAARTLGLVKNNEGALASIIEAVKNKENQAIAGDMLVALEGFDLSNQYVELFKLYLFGSFKVSMIAKNLLDYKEFEITARVLKKAQKHWDHYSNNIKHDDVFDLRKAEVEEMLDDIRKFLNT
jgi:hypothetical protein